mmetsp:Transcript_12489/g.16496  ORF Transcript_12489/g.16496 Transcript_12489/m.16496 type:complete len:89 (+) Transcript_12489:264-530(+)
MREHQHTRTKKYRLDFDDEDEAIIIIIVRRTSTRATTTVQAQQLLHVLNYGVVALFLGTPSLLIVRRGKWCNMGRLSGEVFDFRKCLF